MSLFKIAINCVRRTVSQASTGLASGLVSDLKFKMDNQAAPLRNTYIRTMSDLVSSRSPHVCNNEVNFPCLVSIGWRSSKLLTEILWKKQQCCAFQKWRQKNVWHRSGIGIGMGRLARISADLFWKERREARRPKKVRADKANSMNKISVL